MKKINFKLSLWALLIPLLGLAQMQNFSRQDSLRGSITPERAWWDLNYYHLTLNVNPLDSSVNGSTKVQYTVLENHQKIQIDLQAPMHIDKVLQDGKALAFEADGNAWYIDLEKEQQAQHTEMLEVYFSGKPPVSPQPPWVGGFSWERDGKGDPFIATSCQGEGASMWWACKDHQYDEPDSMLIWVTAPEKLMDVSNGKFLGSTDNENGTTTWKWFVSNPINNYGVNVNIADYAHFSETYKGEKGLLPCDYYVLKENLKRAKKQFKDAERTLEAFEHWFGPYPFYEDGFKLVEVPYLGMEHQSAVSYGNGYENGYLGTDLSQTGEGLKFDYIIIHESGHEWFGNNITSKDIADMWIHESFTTYSENLFLDYHYGKVSAEKYVIGQRSRILNDKPIIGPYHVNTAGSGDMYFKGANMLHTLRKAVNDDEKWRSYLRALNQHFRHKTITTEEVETFTSKTLGMNLKGFFDQYLRDIRIPVLEYRFMPTGMQYRWSNCVSNFKLPIKVKINDDEKWITPNTEWQYIFGYDENANLNVDPGFYIIPFNVTGN